MQSSNVAANSLFSASYPTAQRTDLPSDTSKQLYPTQYADQDYGRYNYDYGKSSDYAGYQQAAGYGNNVTDPEEVDEELMRQIKEIFSDDDDENLPLAGPEKPSISAVNYERNSPGTFEGQATSLTPPGDKIMRSDSPSAVPALLHLKIQSQSARINNIKLLEERIQSRSETIYMALINHWKLDAEEIYNSFQKEHAFLEANWPVSLMDHEYFSNSAYNQMYTTYSSIMITLADMEQDVLKDIEQPHPDSFPRVLLANYLAQLDDILPQTRNDPSSLNNIASTFADVRKAIQLLVPKEHLGDCFLIHRMTQLLDKPTRKAWNISLGNSAQIPTFREFDNFLVDRVRALERIDSVSSTRKPSPSTPSGRVTRVSALERIDALPSTRRASPSRSSRRLARAYTRSPTSRTQSKRSGSKGTIKNRIKTSKVTHSSRISKKPCAYCMEQHYIVACPSFRLLFIEERRAFVSEKNLCFNCFGQHTAKHCMSKIMCKKCGGDHHTMIHDPKYHEPKIHSPQG